MRVFLSTHDVGVLDGSFLFTAHTFNTAPRCVLVPRKQVTKSQSLTLVKNLVRVSISTVCYLRNIFPDSCFQERSYGMDVFTLVFILSRGGEFPTFNLMYGSYV